jgi:hypothetical protein
VRIQTDLGLEFQGAAVAYFSKQAIEAFAQGSVPMSGVWRLPPLYSSGVRYAPEPHHGEGLEDFALPNVTFARKCGDCDDLCIYRIWELRVAGEFATCNAIWLNNAVHVRVRRANGQLEDPSILLGARPQ